MPAMSIVATFSDQHDLRVLLASVVAIDVHQIRRHGLPPLYASGVRYRREFCLAENVPETCERFLTALALVQERFGDCDDLAPYRAAELRLQGIKANAIPVRSSVGWHCVVEWPNGRIEDPSRRLGME